MKKLIKPLIFNLIYIALVGALFEFGSHLIYGHLRQQLVLNEPPAVAGLSLSGRPKSAQVSFKSGPVRTVYETNSLGFRDQEHTVEKPDGVYRLAIFGDSFTEGWGAPQDDIFPVVLQKLLNEKNDGTKYEVLNFGLQGSGPGLMEYLYPRIADRYCPDLVIFASFLGNDFIDAAIPVSPDRNPFRHDQGLAAVRLFKMILKSLRSEESRDFEELVANPRFETLDPELKALARSHSVHLPLLSYALRVPDVFLKSLTEISAEQEAAYHDIIKRSVVELGSAGVPSFWNVLIPMSVQVSTEQFGQLQRMGFLIPESLLEERGPQQKARRALDIITPPEGMNLLTLDLTERYRQESVGGPLYLEFDAHLNSRGHLVTAKALAEQLLTQRSQARLPPRARCPSVDKNEGPHL